MSEHYVQSQRGNWNANKVFNLPDYMQSDLQLQMIGIAIIDRIKRSRNPCKHIC